MKVFISWSGQLSQSIARALRDWLPTVVQHVEPWMSDEDVKSGTRWNDKVAEALDQTDFGIVCVTASNQHEPWLMFEAGTLAKRLDVGRVVPLCLDLAPADVTGPLEAFQGRCVDESGMRKLVRDMMVLREKPPAQAQIDRLFEAMWPALKSQVKEAEQQIPGPRAAQRSPQEMLEELIDRVRRLERGQDRDRLPQLRWQSPATNPVEPPTIAHLFVELLRQDDAFDTPEEKQQFFRELFANTWESLTRGKPADTTKPDDNGPSSAPKDEG